MSYRFLTLIIAASAVMPSGHACMNGPGGRPCVFVASACGSASDATLQRSTIGNCAQAPVVRVCGYTTMAISAGNVTCICGIQIDSTVVASIDAVDFVSKGDGMSLGFDFQRDTQAETEIGANAPLGVPGTGWFGFSSSHPSLSAGVESELVLYVSLQSGKTLTDFYAALSTAYFATGGLKAASGGGFEIDHPAYVQAGPVTPALLYGCRANPDGSMAYSSSQAPAPGASLSIELDDPTAPAQATGSAILLAAASLDANFPCGTVVPGDGELILDGSTMFVVTSATWQSGTAAVIPITLPSDPSLIGVTAYMQGFINEQNPSGGQLTQALELLIGD